MASTDTSAAQNTKSDISRPRKVAVHPKYAEMVQTAITSLKERGGSSRQAILKYIIKNFTVGNDENLINSHVKKALKAGIDNNSLKQAKGTGASGSFRLGEVKKAAPKAKKIEKPKQKALAKVKKPKQDKKSSTTTKNTIKPKNAKVTTEKFSSKAVKAKALPQTTPKTSKPTTTQKNASKQKKVATTKAQKTKPKKTTKVAAKPKKATSKPKKGAPKK